MENKPTVSTFDGHAYVNYVRLRDSMHFHHDSIKNVVKMFSEVLILLVEPSTKTGPRESDIELEKPDERRFGRCAAWAKAAVRRGNKRRLSAEAAEQVEEELTAARMKEGRKAALHCCKYRYFK